MALLKEGLVFLGTIGKRDLGSGVCFYLRYNTHFSPEMEYSDRRS